MIDKQIILLQNPSLEVTTNNMIMKKIIFAGFLLIGFAAHSQILERSVTATSGNYYYQAGTGSLSFTAGENAVTTLTTPNNILTQGFQQSDTSTITIVEESISSFSVEIFPNPVFDFLILKNEMNHQLSFSFYDESGRLITVEQQKNNSQIIFDVSKFAEGFYTLSVTDIEKKTVATKRFVKQ